MAPSATTETLNVAVVAKSSTEAPNPLNKDFLELLDDDFIEYYNANLAPLPKTHLLSIEEMRANGHKYASPWCQDFSGESFVKDITLAAADGHKFTARCYHPDEENSPFGAGPYPVYMNFHGENESRRWSSLTDDV